MFHVKHNKVNKRGCELQYNFHNPNHKKQRGKNNMMKKSKKQKYVVYVEYENGVFSENHCILKCTDLQTAKSIYRNLNKKLRWNDYTQTGFYIGYTSRKCCTNFGYFTRETFSRETIKKYFDDLNGGN